MKRAKRNYKYTLPSIFTLGNMAAGYISLVFTGEEKFLLSAVAILCAGIFDLLDGQVARLTHTASKFGEELDSLADLVSFGVAPALLIYATVFWRYGKLGWGLVFLYLLMVSVRLARFNAREESRERRYFNGLATPFAAGLLASFVLLMGRENQQVIPETFSFLVKRIPFIYRVAPLAMVLVAYLMVSNIKYPGSLRLTGKKKNSLWIFLCAVVGGTLIIFRPYDACFYFFAAYILGGGIFVNITRQRRQKRKKVLNDFYQQTNHPGSQ